MSIVINKKEVDHDSIEIDFIQGIHKSASFVDGTPLDEDDLCKLDEIREAELTEEMQNYRRE